MELDKQIHRDELKLRLLVTDKCNLDCSFCLNDFQPKVKKNFHFIEDEVAFNAIESYSEYVKGKYPSQIYFSGGEPTLHQNLPSFLKFAKEKNSRTTLVTNGYFGKKIESDLDGIVDCLHISAYKKDEKLRERAIRMNAEIQGVYSGKDSYLDLDFLEFYVSKGLNVKIFSDFFEDREGDYFHFLNLAEEKFPGKISGRYTGHQENRGIGCFGCDRKCITLKAAWVYPNGETSPCAQHLFTKTPKSSKDWEKYFQSVEEFHRAD